MFKKILIPVDGSQHAQRAIEIGCDLAKVYGAAVVLLHVMEEIGSSRVPEGLESLEHVEHIRVTDTDILAGLARNILDVAAASCDRLGCRALTRELQTGSPAKTIVDTASACNADLIVMGRRGLGRVADLMLGSVSHRVTQLADCACLTVK